jgi:uncharacterized membrane protein YqgA involved in biofilm formation
MPLTGTLVNFAAIVLGGAVGLVFRKGLPEKYLDAVILVIALVVFAIGVNYTLAAQQSLEQVLTLIVSAIAGTLLGTLLRLERGLNRLAEGVQARLKSSGGRFAEGFTTCTLIYCVGAMAITGAIAGGLNGDHSILFVKSVMDGVTAVFFASALGAGVLASAVPVLLYQGSIALAATLLKGALSGDVITAMSAAGGVALMALAVSMSGVKKIEVANILPSIFLPIGVLPLVRMLVGIIK